jgi:hypothetical protein
MKIDTDKLEMVIANLAKLTKGACCSSSVFIGEISGKPIRLEVMLVSEAEDECDYEGINPKFMCVDGK